MSCTSVSSRLLRQRRNIFTSLLLAGSLAVAPAGAQVPSAQALAALSERAATGDPESLNSLGNLYANGRGVPRNDAEALRCYAKAAANNYAPALFNLGMMHELGRGVTADAGKAFDYYHKAADLGFALAQYNVGNMYANGTGVKADPFEAVLWLRQAAEQGVAEAQFNVGLAYETGRGVAADLVQAQRWYLLAANQGYARAQYNLAVLLEEGLGSPKDEARAAQLYLASARQGFGPAQNNYGIMVGEGRGGLQADLVEAYAWLSLAIENGVKTSGRELLAGRLTQPQLTAANRRILQLKGGVETAPAAVAATPAATTAPAGSPGGPALAASAAPTPDPAIVELRRRVEELTSTNARLVAGNAELAQKMQTPAATPDERINQLQRDNARLNEEVKRSTVAMSSLYRELREARAKLDSQPAVNTALPGAGTADPTHLQTEIAALTAENQRLSTAAVPPEELQRLRAVADNAAKSQDEVATWKRQLADTNAELARVRQALASAEVAKSQAEQRLSTLTADAKSEAGAVREVEDKLAQTRADLVASRRETEEIRVQLQASQANLTILKNQQAKGADEGVMNAQQAEAYAEKLESSNQALTAQIDTLKTQVAGQQARSAGLETANRDLQSNVGDLKQQVARVNAENETLKTQQAQKLAAGNTAELARLKAQVDDTAGALAERDAKIATLTSQAQSLQLDVENARKSAEAALAAQSAAAQAVPEAKAMLLEIQTLQAHSAQLESQLAEDRARSANALSTLAAQLKLANETNESLAEANRSLISAQKSGAITLKGDLDNANKQVAELTALNERITQDRDEQKRQAGNLSGRLGQAEAQLTALREATARAESAADELEQVKARLAERDAAIDKQGDSVAELTGLNADLGKERDQLLARLLQAQESLKQSSAKVEALQAETDRLRASDTLAANLQKELEDTRRKSADAEQRVQLRTAAESRLTDEKAGLQQQLDMVNARFDSLRAENSRLAGASTALAEAEARLATLSAASTQLSETQRTLGDLRTENARLKDSVQALDRDRTSRVAALQQENAALSARLRQAQGTLDQIAAAARLMNPSASPQTASGGTPARTSTEVSQTPRYHTVAEGDSLSRISLRYYGTANRWQEIYEANRAVLSQENVLRPGQQLVLP